MEKDVVISIKGMQNYEGEDSDTIELVTEGRLTRDEGGYTLSYQESELTGLEGTLTTIQVEGGAGHPHAGRGGQLPDGLSGGPPPSLHV